MVYLSLGEESDESTNLGAGSWNVVTSPQFGAVSGLGLTSGLVCWERMKTKHGDKLAEIHCNHRAFATNTHIHWINMQSG